MNKKIAVSLLSLFIFLLWLFWGIYVSDGEEWWTAYYFESESYDVRVGRISIIRVLIGAISSASIGFIIYKLIREK